VADAATLAAALRSRDSAKLRKRHMLALVRAWHYKSDVWRLKHARGEYRRAAQEEDAAAAALALHSSLVSAGAPGRLLGSAAGAATRANGASAVSAILALGASVAPTAMATFAAAELRPLGASAAGWLRGAELRAAKQAGSSSDAARLEAASAVERLRAEHRALQEDKRALIERAPRVKPAVSELQPDLRVMLVDGITPLDLIDKIIGPQTQPVGDDGFTVFFLEMLDAIIVHGVAGSCSKNIFFQF
jgi:hypothetical protein